MSRNLDKGIFGFTEKGFVPSPQAAIAFIAEIVALVVLLASFVPALHWRRQAVVNPAVGGALALIVIAIGIVAAGGVGTGHRLQLVVVRHGRGRHHHRRRRDHHHGRRRRRRDHHRRRRDRNHRRRRRRRDATTTVAAGATATTTVAAGGATTAAGPSTAAPSASTTAVTIKGFSFDPKAATVTVGETITWTNEDGTDHNVKAVRRQLRQREPR